MNEIALLTGVSKGSVINVLKRVARAGLEGEESAELPDAELMARLYPPPQSIDDPAEPDFDALFEELSTKEVNVQLLWEEYQADNPHGISRSTFYERLKKAGPVEQPRPSMHQIYKGGERLLLDYSGLKGSYIDAKSQQRVEVEIFVASWAASSYLYVEASHSQDIADWVGSSVRALRSFGCAPAYLVPDNLKSAVTRADFHDPTINRAYNAMAEHYDCAVLPARARKPQDKAGVEANVKFIQTHLLGRLRKRVFRSLDELNEAIRELLPKINSRLMQRYHRSRTERFEALDRPHASELPTHDFRCTEIKDDVKVEEDHHVAYEGHYYSVPWRLTGTRVDIWYGGDHVAIYHDKEQVAVHRFSTERGGYTTNDQHRPPNHLFMRRLNPLWVLSQAEKIGAKTHNILRRLIEADRKHCELAIRKGLGIIELSRDFAPEQVESATAWAFEHGQFRIQDIRTILEQGLGDQTHSPAGGAASHILHENLRGPGHYLDRDSSPSFQEDLA